MSPDTITTGSREIDQYCAAVRAGLADLPESLRDDLLEDLPDHLAEVRREGVTSLRDRLGEPAEYAHELRAAAGLEASGGSLAAAGWPRLIRAVGRGTNFAARADLQLGQAVGYPRLSDLRRALLPGWWVLRGWVVAQFLCPGSGQGFIPEVERSPLMGLVVLIAVIAASVWFGRRSTRFTTWPRRAVIAASTVIAFWAVAGLAHNMSYASNEYVDVGPGYPVRDYDPGRDYNPNHDYDSDLDFAEPSTSDLTVYDRDGNPVPDARLYDQSGAPINLGSGQCRDGSPAPGTSTELGADLAWTYPLCPADPGPFRAGPGPIAPPLTATDPGLSADPAVEPAQE